MKRRPREDVKGIAPDPHEFKRLLSQLGDFVSFTKQLRKDEPPQGVQMSRDYGAAYAEGHDASVSESAGRISYSVSNSNPTLSVYSSPAKRRAREACVSAFEACKNAESELKKAEKALRGVFPRESRPIGRQKSGSLIHPDDLAAAREAQKKRQEEGESWGV